LKLDLSYNDIGSKGLAFVADGLKYCSKLQELYVSDCNIKSDSIPSILRIFETCKYLHRLRLDDNESIGVEGGTLLVNGWQHKNVLTIELGDCFGEPHEQALTIGEGCCSSCEQLLESYHLHDYVLIRLNSTSLPKILSENLH